MSSRSMDSSLFSENFAGSYISGTSNASAPKISAELFQSISAAAAAEGKSMEELADEVDQENEKLQLQYNDAMLSMEENALRRRLAYETNLLETSQK